MAARPKTPEALAGIVAAWGSGTAGRLLGAVRHRLARAANAIQTRGGTERLAARTTHPHWIIGRGLCFYRCEDFSAVPRNRRDGAVAHRLAVWSPFERTGHHCVWHGGVAMVWFWNADTIDVDPDVLGVADSAASRIRMLPETVFYPRPGTGRRDDGLAVQKCREGYELQFWRDDVLADSLWQPTAPDASRVEWFLGRQSLAASTSAPPPEPNPSDFAPDPWASPITPRAWLLANERALVLSVLAVAAVIAAFQEARYWRLHIATQSDEVELLRVEDEIAPVLSKRSELANLNRRGARLAEWLETPSQAFVMARVDRALPDPTIEFRTWRFQDRDLTMVLVGPELDAVAVIAGLQQERLFADVEPGQVRQGGLAIDMTVATGAQAAATGGPGNASP